MKADMTSLVGKFLSLMYSGKKRLGVPVESSQRPAEGAGFGRARIECDEQMATTVGPEKKMVKASWSLGSHKGRHES